MERLTRDPDLRLAIDAAEAQVADGTLAPSIAVEHLVKQADL
jgi:hypothetical protein